MLSKQTRELTFNTYHRQIFHPHLHNKSLKDYRIFLILIFLNQTSFP